MCRANGYFSRVSKYIQTQVFDAAFGSRADGPLNANQTWCGRDDTTELYFRDWDHVKSCFSSNFVKEVIAPDGPFFADFETSIVLMASERSVPLATQLASRGLDTTDNPTVAMYFISTPDDERNGKLLESEVTPLLVESIQRYCQEDAIDLIVNVGETSEQFDLNAYFGGSGTPQYALVYKIHLKGPESVPQLRKSQKEFESLVGGLIDLHTSFILFSKEAVVLDVEKNIRVSCPTTSSHLLEFLMIRFSSRSIDNLISTIFQAKVTLYLSRICI